MQAPSSPTGVTVTNSVIRDNRANLAASMPSDVPSGAQAAAGGIHVADTGSATITNTTIEHDTVAMTNTVGDAIAYSGGISTDVDVALSHDVISDNHVSAVALPGSTGYASSDSGAGEMSGTIDDVRLTDNSDMAVSAAGYAEAFSGASVFYGGSLTNSVVSGNVLRASSAHGTVYLTGAGLVAGGPLMVRNTIVRGNTGTAQGSTGTAQGGGMADVDQSQSPALPTGGPLDLVNSSVIVNELSGSPGITVQGGGLYTTYPLSRTNSTVRDNTPDNCVGSSC
jgi:hypothetical protein